MTALSIPSEAGCPSSSALGLAGTNLVLSAAFRLRAQPPQQKDNELGPAMHGHMCIYQQLSVPSVALALVS